MKPKTILTSVATALVLTACDRTSTPTPSTETVPEEATPAIASSPKPVAITKTFETSRLATAIDAYIREPTALHDSAVEKAFADIAVEIAELQERAAKTTGSDRDEAIAKAKNLTDYRDAETLRFAKAKAAVKGETQPPVDTRSGAQKIEDGAKDAANTVEDAAKDAGNAVKDAAEKTGDAIKDAVH